MDSVDLDFDFVTSFSEIKAFRSCQLRRHLKFVKGLSPKRKDYNLALGDVVHGLLKEYSRDLPWEDKLAHYRKKYSLLIEDRDLVEQSRLIMLGYIRHWRDQPLKYLLVEERIGPLELIERPRIGLVLVPDAVVEDQDGSQWLLERKTRRKFGDPGLLIKDMQAAIYKWGLDKHGLSVEGTLWDEIRQKLPTVPPVLKRGGLSMAKKIDTDARTYLKALKEYGIDPEGYRPFLKHLKRTKASAFYRRQHFAFHQPAVDRILRDVRETALEMYRRIGKRPVMELGFQCRLCEFQRYCETKLDGLDTSFLLKSDFTRRKRGEVRRDAES